MRKNLLLFIVTVLLLSTGLDAQNKVWDFGNDEANFPVAPAFQDTRVIDGLTLVGGGSNFATVESNSSTWDDGYTSENRLKSEGSSSVGGDGLPTRRYMEFSITGPVAIKLWYRFSGTGTPRAVVIADASGAEIARFDSPGDTTPRYIEANYTGSEDTILVFSDGNAVNYYKLEISTTLLSTNDAEMSISSRVRTVNDRIFVSNVKMNTEVSIFSITGALIKTINTDSDLDFSFNPGLYIARITTAEGRKSVKLVVQ